MEQRVAFASGELTLEGLLWVPPDGTGDMGAVLCHPHPLRGGDMYSNVISAIARAFQEQHVATLRFNFRGTGRSTGTHGEGETEGADVAAATTYLLQCHAVSHLAVVGYSFGSAVGVRAGAADPRVHMLIGVALPVGRFEVSTLQTCTKAKLFVVGDRDHVCPVDTLRTYVAQWPEPTELAVLPGADHFFAGREAEVAQAVVEFVTTASRAS